MSTRLLHIVATPRGLASNTGRISSVLLEELDARYQDLSVTTLDLFSADLPAVAGSNIKSKYALMTGQSIDEAARSSWGEIEKTIEGFLDADVYLMTVPMWNFSIPYALKYYIDCLVQPGYTFGYGVDGVYGMVKDRKMVVITSRGNNYSPDSPMHQYDQQEPYLRTVFGFIGFDDIDFINAEPMDVDPHRREVALEQAKRRARPGPTGRCIRDGRCLTRARQNPHHRRHRRRSRPGRLRQ